MKSIRSQLWETALNGFSHFLSLHCFVPLFLVCLLPGSWLYCFPQYGLLPSTQPFARKGEEIQESELQQCPLFAQNSVQTSQVCSMQQSNPAASEEPHHPVWCPCPFTTMARAACHLQLLNFQVFLGVKQALGFSIFLTTGLVCSFSNLLHTYLFLSFRNRKCEGVVCFLSSSPLRILCLKKQKTLLWFLLLFQDRTRLNRCLYYL